MRVLVVVPVVCLFLSVPSSHETGLREEFAWTRITYRWPRVKRQVIAERRYGGGVRSTESGDTILFDGITNAEAPNLGGRVRGEEVVGRPPANIDYQYVNNIPMGANVWRNKLFITVPRRRLGVPSTLNYVPLDSPNRRNVPLIPYPNWDLNMYPDPKGFRGGNFVSVYRVAIDPCDRMWFVDTGVIELPDNRTVVKQSEIVLINLIDDQVIGRYTIPEDQVTPTSNLASITVDVTRDTCSDAYAYIPDLGGYGLIVYSLRDNRSWRATHNYFYLEPLSGEFNIAGHQFQWNDGIFSVELSDIKPDRFRDLYFHSMAGTNMYKVSTKVLRNETLATRSYHGDDFTLIGDRGPNTQTSSADLHKPTGVMFLGLVNQNALACWNTFSPLTSSGIVQRDDERMIYPSDVKIVADKVYLLTNTMPEFLYGRLNYDQVNFRVWVNTVAGAVADTPCAMVGRGSGRY